jgi:hypothetical protein
MSDQSVETFFQYGSVVQACVMSHVVPSVLLICNENGWLTRSNGL